MRAKLALGVLLLAFATGVAQAAELTLAQAEVELSAAEGLPAKEDRGAAVWRWHIKELERAFRAATPQHPGRAHLGLGRCELLLGRYREAAGSFRRALKAAPGDRTAAADLRRAQRLAAIARAARHLLPKGSMVVQVAPMRADGREWWLVLSAGLEPKKPWSDDEFYRDARLRLLRKTGHGLEQVWRSDLLRVQPWPATWWTNDIRMYVLDEAPPKVLVGGVFYGAGWAPAHLDAFVWREGKLARVFTLDSEEFFWIQDLNGDGRHETGGFRKIGGGLAIAFMPRWSDVCAYEGGAYVVTNERFPKEFIAIESEIRQRLEEHPDNYELLEYLGICQEIQGDRAAALEAYRRAESALLPPASEGDAAGAKLHASELAEIRARISRLSQ